MCVFVCGGEGYARVHACMCVYVCLCVCVCACERDPLSWIVNCFTYYVYLSFTRPDAVLLLFSLTACSLPNKEVPSKNCIEWYEFVDEKARPDKVNILRGRKNYNDIIKSKGQVN